MGGLPYGRAELFTAADASGRAPLWQSPPLAAAADSKLQEDTSAGFRVSVHGIAKVPSLRPRSASVWISPSPRPARRTPQPSERVPECLC